MSVDNIIDGRNRAVEVLNILNPTTASLLYGDLAYLAFTFEDCCGATVRTSKDKYIKVDSRMFESNKIMCEEAGISHVLFLGFQWNNNRCVFRLDGDIIEDCFSYLTAVRKYMVFKMETVRNMHGVIRIL